MKKIQYLQRLCAMIANKIRTILKERKITVKRLAHSIQMTESNLYRCFVRDSIETKYLIRAAKFLEISPTYFLADNTPQSAPEILAQGLASHETIQYLQMLVAEKERLIVQKEKYIDLLEKQLKIGQTTPIPTAATEK
ncbi:MAG: hypothetical protein LC115_13120 [Bacteroidia bacterium]|nr:hypothetical protein [Bacteroidia bacterium]